MHSNKVLIWPVFFLTVSLIACSGEKTAAEYLESANSHLQSGDVRTALIETRNAVSQAPEDSAARLLLGTLELKQGNAPGAEDAFLKAVELGASQINTYASLAEAYFIQGKFDDLANIDISDLIASDKARVLGYQSEAALAQGDPTAANQLAGDALKSDPVSAIALTANARLQLLEGNIPEARTYLASAVDSSPDYSAAWELLGDIESSEQRLPEALTAYSRAAETATTGISALFKRARAHLQLGDFASASADIDIFEKSNVDSPVVSLLKAEILLRQSKLADAQLALEDSLKNAPDYQAAVRTLAVTHMLRGNLGQAEQYGKQYFDNSDSDDSRVLLATIRLQADRVKLSEETLQPLEQSGRLNLLGTQILATAQLKQNKFDDAVETMLRLKANLTRAGVEEPVDLAMLSNPSSVMSATLLGSESSEVKDDYLTEQELLVVNAVDAWLSEDTESALRMANSLLEKQPDNADVHLLLARMYLSVGDKDAATASLNAARQFQDSVGTADILSAIISMESGNTDVARTTLEKAFTDARGPAREEILLALVRVEAISGNDEQVLAHLEQARNENPSSYQPSLALAKHYTRVPNHEKVLESLADLTATGRQNPEVIELQAIANIALKQFDEAIKLVTPMVQTELDTPRWRYLRAKANAGKNNTDAVQKDLEVALRIDPNYAPAKVAKANLSVLSNDFQQADIQLAQLETLIPESYVVSQLSNRIATARERKAQSEAASNANTPPATTQEVMERARIHWAAGEQTKALDTMLEWLDTNPEDIAIRLTLANTYSSINQTDNAAQEFQEVLKIDQDNFIALNNLAWQLREQDPEAAIAYASRAVELQPDNADTLDTLAVIQYEQDLLIEAGQTFAKIRALQPTNPSILFHGARIQAALGQEEDAKEILTPLIEQGIEFPEAEAARALFNTL